MKNIVEVALSLIHMVFEAIKALITGDSSGTAPEDSFDNRTDFLRETLIDIYREKIGYSVPLAEDFDLFNKTVDLSAVVGAFRQEGFEVEGLGGVFERQDGDRARVYEMSDVDEQGYLLPGGSLTEGGFYVVVGRGFVNTSANGKMLALFVRQLDEEGNWGEVMAISGCIFSGLRFVEVPEKQIYSGSS